MPANENILYKLASLSNKGTDKNPKRLSLAGNPTKVLLGFFNFRSLNSAGKSTGIAGGNRGQAVQSYREGHGVFARKGLFLLLDCQMIDSCRPHERTHYLGRLPVNPERL